MLLEFADACNGSTDVVNGEMEINEYVAEVEAAEDASKTPVGVYLIEVEDVV
jgi:hypothetical protein